jgi:hypothetical protein
MPSAATPSILPLWEVTGRIVKPNDIQYHQARAARELDMGLSTDCMNAARAHLQLSSLHLQRARELGAVEAKPSQHM